MKDETKNDIYDLLDLLNKLYSLSFLSDKDRLNEVRNEIMSTFPPKQQAPVDSIVPLEKQMKYLKPLSQTATLSSDSCDYIVIVYWNKFMGRQSKRLIRFIQDNSKLETERKVKIIYANTDNIFTGH